MEYCQILFAVAARKLICS